jgi:biotin transport system substrate-specific component
MPAITSRKLSLPGAMPIRIRVGSNRQEENRVMTGGRSLVYIATFAAFIGALGVVPGLTLPLGGGVPITLQSLGIMLAGVVLGPVRGAAAVLLFLGLVAVGMPLLSGGRGGADVFLGPSGGFLIGFPIAAFACGVVMRLLKHSAVFPASLAAAIIGGIGVLYAVGVPGLAAFEGLSMQKAAFLSLVYLPGDLIKAFGVAVIAEAISRGRPEALMSRS